MTNKKWWAENIHRFTAGFKGDRFRWNSDFVIALKDHGLPDGLSARKANASLKRIGSSFRIRTCRDWDRGELLQLRYVSQLPLLKRRGWDACMRMAYRQGLGKTTLKNNNDNNKEQHND